MNKLLSLLLISLLFACQPGEQTNHYEEDEIGITAEHGMVVSAHPLASRIGVDILKQGGNAIDAAVAVQFALAVVYPGAGNIGGGGFMVIRIANGESHTLDFREAAPLAAHRDMYLDSAGNVIEGLSLKSHLAVGVPGTVDGMLKAWERFGDLEFEQLIQPAILLAEEGFTMLPGEAKKLNAYKKLFEEANGEDYPLQKGKWHAGDILVQKDLANTLKLIQKNGHDGFYGGEVADKLLKEMQEGGGIITKEDLDTYYAIWREPIIGQYKDYRIISMPPPSSGGVALVSLLNMVEEYPLAAYGHNSVAAIHLMTEAERRVYADRAQHLGDAAHYPVPVKGLLDEPYIRDRMADFDPEQATPSTSIAYGSPQANKSEETTHFSIVDSMGNAVSVTTTLNARYGSRIFVGGAGFLLNNEMDDFSAKPGTPNKYGLVGAEANAIEPGKRMLSSMTPTIVEKDGKLFMVVGSPGGSTIITSVFQTLLNVTEHGMGMQQAVDAPRVHHQWLPDKLYIESSAIDSLTIEILEGMGHIVETRSPIGRVDAILVHLDGTLEGGADNTRGEDAAKGY